MNELATRRRSANKPKGPDATVGYEGKLRQLAFYDALETNDSAIEVLGDETLRAVARELVAAVRSNKSIDWTLPEDVRANMRVLVRRLLRRHECPPDKQEKATPTVIEQSEVQSQVWVAA